MPYYTLNRFYFLIFSIVIGLGLILILYVNILTIQSQQDAISSQLDVILIVADDLDVNSFNLLLENDLLPNIKSNLIEKGITFTNSFVTLPSCCPSRATILSGLYPHNHGVLTNSDIRKFDDSTALPVWLQSSNYTTGFVGKYLNGYGKKSSLGYIPKGWDDWQALMYPSTYMMYGYELTDNKIFVKYGENQTDYQTDVLAKRSIDFILESKNSDPSVPIFLYVGVVAPHNEIPRQGGCNFGNGSNFWAIREPTRYLGTMDSIEIVTSESFNEADLTDKPLWIQQNPLLKDSDIQCILNEDYHRLGSIKAIDDLVGEIIKSLRSTNSLDESVIIFTSDNGLLRGEHRFFGKSVPYEESIRVPLIIRSPYSKTNQMDNHLVINNDLMPTILEISGSSSDLILDGRSLIPLLKKSPQDTWRNKFLISFWAQSGIPSYSAIRTIDQLYVEYDNQTREFYDLEKDPFQLDNEINCESSKCKEQIENLRSFLYQLRDCGNGTCQIIENRR